jgi:uncharacterized protein with beta-barrel porin domain
MGLPSQNGGNGTGPDGAGGGGGGGGANGNGAGTATVTNTSVLTGGTGGKGGNGDGLGGGGGGGGGGGYGAIVTGGGASSNTSTIAGGAGGGGGNGLAGVAVSGNGGDGGVGVQFTTSGATFTNSGTVTGGNGGVGGTAVGTPAVDGGAGAGGAGIVGGGLTIINSSTIAGGLSGDGVTRANAVTFTGGSNILELQAGSSITGNAVAFSAADTLRLGGTTNSGFDVSQIGASAQYQGFGNFQKTGSSTWTLTGTNANAMPWTINAGTLAVNGTMANSTMTVNAGGTLAGTGTVGSTTIAGGGIFAPGSGAAGSTMTVAGNLAFQSGALYLVQVNPSTASMANVTGTAALTGGSVQAAFAPGSYMARSYDILHAAGGLGGTTFSGVSGNVPAGFGASLSYSATDVFLNLSAQLGAGTALNQNQQNVAGAINNFFNGGGALPPSFGAIFGLTGGNLGNALTLLSGEAATGAQQGAFRLMDQFLDAMLDPFAYGAGGFAPGGPARAFAPERAGMPEEIALAYANVMKAPAYKAPVTFEQRWTAWAAGFGGTNRTSGDPAVVGSHDLTARAGGVAAGLDYHVSRETVIGAALAGGATNWDLAQGLGGGKSDAFQAGVYGATRAGPAYLAAALAFANHWMSTDRFAAFGDHLTARFDARSIGGRLETGYRFGTPAAGIAPYAALQAQSFRTPTYSETDLTGGGFALSYAGRTATDTRSELGARFDHVAALDPTVLLILRGRLAWAHDWVTDPSLAAAFQALPGASFIVNGATPATDSALVSAGAELRLVNGVTLLAKFDGEFARGSQTYAGTGTLRVAW